ncbi:hypothetical protein [Alkalimarinus coralli]|uniref:hypothetical protein n=1 Tax=Alkalimarinus coralli TaxID=2935863 RepID=UPI00202B11EA|nr:hypothetical protein [Alkalimarinus coralli]
MKGGTTGIKEVVTIKHKTLIPLRCIKATNAIPNCKHFVAVMKGGTTGIKEMVTIEHKTLIPLRCIKATNAIPTVSTS